jgi:hypothetical protein
MEVCGICGDVESSLRAGICVERGSSHGDVESSRKRGAVQMWSLGRCGSLRGELSQVERLFLHRDSEDPQVPAIVDDTPHIEVTEKVDVTQ